MLWQGDGRLSNIGGKCVGWSNPWYNNGLRGRAYKKWLRFSSSVTWCREEATRTPDPHVPNVVRYQLRYFSLFRCKGTTFFLFHQIFLHLIIFRARVYHIYIAEITYYSTQKYALLQTWCGKNSKQIKNIWKYLVGSQKSSTFALDLRLRLVNLENGKNLLKNCNAENQPLTKKMQRKLKKVAWKFGQSEKKQYLCSRFRAKRKMRRKITVIFERLKQ